MLEEEGEEEEYEQKGESGEETETQQYTASVPNDSSTSSSTTKNGSSFSWSSFSEGEPVSASGHAGMKLDACLMPFHMKWSFGMNIPTAALNITGKGKTAVVFAATHAGVIYDYVAKDMRLLQGHKNLISGISVDHSGTWLATADKGEDSTIIVWDTLNCTPVNTIFNPHPGCGTATIAISGNAKYVVTVGNEPKPIIHFWRWTFGNDKPDGSYPTQSNFGLPKKICFNPDVCEHVMVAFERQVLFFQWDTQANELRPFEMPIIKNMKKCGTINDCTYMDSCHECCACTTEGYVLIFGSTVYARTFEETELQNLKIFVNGIKVCTCAINCIASADEVVVTGDVEGKIKFYDKTIKLLYWCQKFTLPSITGISFNLEPRLYKLRDVSELYDDILNDECDCPPAYCPCEDRSEEYEYLYSQLVPSDATVQQLPFIIRDFIIATIDGRVAAIDYMHNRCDFFFRKASSAVAAVDTHDEHPYLAVAYTNGMICLYNYNTHELVVEATIPEEHDDDYVEDCPLVTCLKYSPQSYHLACGKENGSVLFLEPIVLTPKAGPKHFTNSRIIKLAFALDSKYFAYYDENATVCLMKYSSDEEDWMILGKIRSHYKPVNDILFTPHLPSRFFSIGDDRYLVEYDLERSEYPTIELITRERIEQSSIPVCFIYYPSKQGATETYFYVSDNQHKYKIVNDVSFMCHSVVLGPAYDCYKGHPVNKMLILPHHNDEYMIFANTNSIGIQMLPANGNPYKYVGTIGHPTELLKFRVDNEGKYIFTIGKGDSCVLMWEINVQSVQAMLKMGGIELEPYYCLIEGGIHGWLFREMQDLFYYMQILHQGENTVLPRIVSDKIPVAELPDLMRACGFYPSEYEIENMLVDVKYRNFGKTNALKDDVSFLEFVQLYINYRPPHGVCIEALRKGFNTMCLAGEGAGTYSINRASFSSLICEKGEYFSTNKARTCLATLMHENEADADEAAYNDFTFLPEDIDFDAFLEDILGIDLERQTIEETDNPVNVAEEAEQGC